MTVQESYRRTMQAEGVDMNDVMDFDKTQQYTFSHDMIRDIYVENMEICERKNLNEEQTLDSFVLALVDKGMPQDEAEEVCEIYDRTNGEFFNSDDDDDDFDDDDDDIPPDDDDDYGDDTEIIEV